MIIREKPLLLRSLIYSFVLSFLAASLASGGSFPGDNKVADRSVIDSFSSGEAQDLIVIFDDTDASEKAAAMRVRSGSDHDTADIIMAKSALRQALKTAVKMNFIEQEVEALRDYSHLPAMHVSVKSLGSLKKLAADKRVRGIYKNRVLKPLLAESLPLIGQPAVQTAGFVGAGTAVAVLDSGVDYRGALYGDGTAFGSCGINTPGDCLSLPALRPGCKVACSHDFTATDDGFLDNDGHGTNVAAIVMGVAPDTRIVALDIFRGSGNGLSALVSDIIGAMNWVIAHKSTYNIVAINMSLGGSEYETSPCTNDVFAVPVAEARAAGILSTVASGNDGYTNAISSPACVPAAVSVGAVFDSAFGSLALCGSPEVTAADKVTCFSNSSSFLTLLAPGSEITAGGWIMSGTSQAAPHVAGAVAVLRGANAFPAESVGNTVDRLISTGVMVTDTRNPLSPITKPRINLAAALDVSISGRVTDSAGDPVEGVVMNLFLGGVYVGSAVTDSSGYYFFTDLDSSTYTVEPSSPSVEFSPLIRTVAVPASGVNFTARIYSLSGIVRTSKGTPVPGVTVTLSGGPSSGSVLTDAAGNYRVTGLAAGNYVVTPTRPGYAFSPSSAPVNLNANVTGLNFTVPAYRIAGHVYANADSSPLSGVTITLTGATAKTAITGSDGAFMFDDLINGAYTVTPGYAGYSFTPVAKEVIVSNADQNNVTFFRAFTISGYVKAKKGSLVFPDVIITLSGDLSAETLTDSTGYYQFEELIAGSYTVTPGKLSFVFLPAAKGVTLKKKNVALDFKVRTYTISGTVKTAAGAAMPGVSLTVTGCGIEAAGQSDSKGKFKMSNLPNCSYTISPGDAAGHIFTPGITPATINNTNVSGIAFSGP